MKNKSLTYVLLLVVGFIWYKVFIRVSSNLSDEDVVLVQPNETKSSFLTIQRDSFSLNAAYRDPFTTTPRQAVSAATELTKIVPDKKIIKKVAISWPLIQYKGLVKKSTSNDPLAIIYIDGIQLYMRKGERVFDGILVKSVHRDSVVIVYKKERRAVWRE